MNIFQILLDRKLKKYPYEKLYELQEKSHEKRKYIKLASVYYELANRYLNEEKTDKALVYYIRFKNLVQSDDKLFTRFMKRWSLVSDIKPNLEKSNQFMSEIRDWVKDKAKDMDTIQKSQWNLLTMAKMCRLFEGISGIPQLQDLSDNYEELLELLVDCLYADYIDEYMFEIMDEDVLEMKGIVFENIPPKYKLLLPNGKYFEPLDLDGDHLHLFCRSALHEMIEWFKGEREDVSIDFVTNSLHYGFYSRAFEEGIENIPACMKEKERIMDDFAFIQSNPDEETFKERMNKYKSLYLPE